MADWLRARGHSEVGKTAIGQALAVIATAEQPSLPLVVNTDTLPAGFGRADHR